MTTREFDFSIMFSFHRLKEKNITGEVERNLISRPLLGSCTRTNVDVRQLGDCVGPCVSWHADVLPISFLCLYSSCVPFLM